MGIGSTIAKTALAGILAAGGIAVVTGVVQGNPTTVTKIVDGDTIDVESSGETTRIRLLNIDTPEIGRGDKPSECLAEEARDFLKNRLPIGTEVRLEFDEEREDKYGRTLAGVFLDDSLINAEIAAEGLAVPMEIAPNRRFYPEVSEASEQAKSANKGIHSVGPECYTADAKNFEELVGAQQKLNDIEQDLQGMVQGDLDLTRIKKARKEVAGVIRGLGSLKYKKIEQSDFQRAAYGDLFRNEVLESSRRASELSTELDVVFREQKQKLRDERKRERERSAAEKESVLEHALEELEQSFDSDAYQAPSQGSPSQHQPQSPQPQPAPAPQQQTPNPASDGGGGADGYTGCRAYGGNYILSNIDSKGRPYAKIDCTTKQQIG